MHILILIQSSLMYIPKGLIDNKSTLVQVIIWRLQLPELMMAPFTDAYASLGLSPWTKWPPFRRRYFQMHLREWKIF